MVACSSIRLFSPMMIGPASATILALGCTTVLAPTDTSPTRELSLQTTAPGAMCSSEEDMSIASWKEKKNSIAF